MKADRSRHYFERKRVLDRDNLPGEITVAEVAELLHVEETTIRTWIRAGRLPARVTNSHGRYVVRLADYQRFTAQTQA